MFDAVGRPSTSVPWGHIVDERTRSDTSLGLRPVVRAEGPAGVVGHEGVDDERGLGDEDRGVPLWGGTDGWTGDGVRVMSRDHWALLSPVTGRRRLRGCPTRDPCVGRSHLSRHPLQRETPSVVTDKQLTDCLKSGWTLRHKGRETTIPPPKWLDRCGVPGGLPGEEGGSTGET